MKLSRFLCILLSWTVVTPVWSQYDDRELLDLVAPDDEKILEEDPVNVKREDLKAVELNLSEKEEIDDLQSLREDIGEVYFEKTNSSNAEVKKVLDEAAEDSKAQAEAAKKVINDPKAQMESRKVEIFDVGKEEGQLLKVASFLENKIPNHEWNEIAKATTDKYVVVQGDNLWQISKRLFGSGFYYPKIWSLNPYITNPHLIEPGMTLLFTTGTQDAPPDIRVGNFGEETVYETTVEGKKMVEKVEDLGRFGDDAEPAWIKQKRKLLEQGTYVQYATEETYEDLHELSKTSLVTEYEKYDPPDAEINVQLAEDDIVSKGFDRNSRVQDKFKEGFYLNTFITSNVVQDLGEITDSKFPFGYLSKHFTVFVKFDPSLSISAGDQFSVYSAQGETTHKNSDRSGYRYTILGQIKTVRKVSDKWECLLTDSTGAIQRGDRITVYTPKINQIIYSFNDRNIEGAIISGFEEKGMFAAGDVVYLDRGRADGIEMGNVMEVFSFTDELTDKKITYNPSYKVGELVVITLTDNFATALVHSLSSAVHTGMLAITKSKEQAARDSRVKNKTVLADIKKMEKKALDDLDVELNLDSINDDLLDKADKIELTEDELEELERQERERNVVQDSEKDLKSLERLEQEIESAESQLNEIKLDEDKLLDQQNLNKVEDGLSKPDANAFEALNEIEREVGRKYIDEDLNSRENPYGLTEYDLEEVDELLNVDENTGQKRSAPEAKRESKKNPPPEKEVISVPEDSGL